MLFLLQLISRPLKSIIQRNFPFRECFAELYFLRVDYIKIRKLADLSKKIKDYITNNQQLKCFLRAGYIK